MLDFDAIMKIRDEELDNQPFASDETRDGLSAYDDAREKYIEAIQKDAFYFGYITAMKHMEGK